MNELTERLTKIIIIAKKLEWTSSPIKNQSYSTMQLSEVEKCMLAMADDSELKRMETWLIEHEENKKSVLLY